MDNKQERYHGAASTKEKFTSNTYDTEVRGGIYHLRNQSTNPTAASVKPKKNGGLKSIIAVALIVALISSVGFLIRENLLLHKLVQDGSKMHVGSSDKMDKPTYVKAESIEAENKEEEKVTSEPLFESAYSDEQGSNCLSIPEIARVGKPSVVAISTEVAVPFGFYFETTLPVAGSGFFISEDGYIATNNHVVEGAQNITVHTDEGQLYDAEVVGTDPLSDLAVIKIEAHKDEEFPAVTFGDSEQLVVGELAVAIGNPSGTLEGSVTAGIISALGRTIDVGGLELNVLQTDASINSGNSGGALFNSSGEVIGINTAKLSGRGRDTFDGIAFAIPSNFAKPILSDLKDHGSVKSRVFLGIAGRGFSSDFAKRYDIADRPGILVSDIIPNSSADVAGLQSGDYIVELDGRATDSIQAVNNMKKNWQIGETIEIVYFRDGEKITTEMILMGENEELPEAEETTIEESDKSL